MMKTIAIVGATEREGVLLSEKLACAKQRLLLVSDNPEKLLALQAKVLEVRPQADVDVVECIKDGCWEADIIILCVPASVDKMVAMLMKEVSTQKIVVSILQKQCDGEELQKLLPYSKLVNLTVDQYSNQISVAGADATANEEILNIFLQAGFTPPVLSHKK